MSSPSARSPSPLRSRSKSIIPGSWRRRRGTTGTGTGTAAVRPTGGRYARNTVPSAAADQAPPPKQPPPTTTSPSSSSSPTSVASLLSGPSMQIRLVRQTCSQRPREREVVVPATRTELALGRRSCAGDWHHLALILAGRCSST